MVEARVGGGSSFSGGGGGGGGGGSSYGGGGGGGGGGSSYDFGDDYGDDYSGSGDDVDFPEFMAAIGYLCLSVIGWLVVSYIFDAIREFLFGEAERTVAKTTKQTQRNKKETQKARRLTRDLRNLQKEDPNFSKYLFTDFAALVFSRFHECRVGAQFSPIRPYIRPQLYGRLAKTELQAIDEIAIGSVTIERVSNSSIHQITVVFEASFKCQKPRKSDQHIYTKERWKFDRKIGVLSPDPDRILRLDCPSCGHSGELEVDGKCSQCDTIVNRGAHGWVVSHRKIINSHTVEPVQVHIGGGGVEPGTRDATVYHPKYADQMRLFNARNPNFDWDRFRTRIQFIFHNLQTAWSSLEWEKARAYETDALFQMHRYWIERYKRQQLRNELEAIQLTKTEICKLEPDPFYETITVRMHASMFDYTVKTNGQVVGGDKNTPRQFTEYWTFVRRSNVDNEREDSVPKDDSQCPSCGAPIQVNAAGICEHCQSKLSSGDFDWVLALIEQDEVYRG